MSNKKNFEILSKSLPKYLPEFFEALTEEINLDNECWGDTWKERGLYWEGKYQEERFYFWFINKYNDWAISDKPFPWLKIAGEAFIGYIREKYLRNK